MNLKEILAKKLQQVNEPTNTDQSDLVVLIDSTDLALEKKEEIINEDSPSLSNRNLFESYPNRSNEKALLCFLILYNKAHSKDVFIGNGDGARLLYYFLDCPKVLSSDYPNTPLGLSIRDSYVINNLLHIPQNAAYWILRKFFD